MKRILDLIADEMKSAFTACGYDASYAKVSFKNEKIDWILCCVVDRDCVTSAVPLS